MRRASVQKSDDGDLVENIIEIRHFCFCFHVSLVVCVCLRPEFQNVAAFSDILDALTHFPCINKNNFSH